MVVGASASADTLQVWQTTMECTGRSKASGSTVSVAVSLEGVTVPPPRYSVLSGPHAPTTGQARSPAPAGRTWPPALLALCTSIYRFSGSREGTPYPLTRVLSPFSTGLGCSYSSHPSRGTHLDALVTGQHRVLSLLGWSTRATGSGFLVRSRCL